MMDIQLRCRGYDIHREASRHTKVDVRFVLLHGINSMEVAETLKRIELYLSEPINIVKAADKPRCFYCAGLNDDDAKECEHCGALL